MKKRTSLYFVPVLALFGGLFASCTDIDIPDHSLDVKYQYELTCSEILLKYVTPEVTIEDQKGNKRTFRIEDNMWTGSDHKVWTESVHYDSLNVTSKMTVRYVPKQGITFQDEPRFDEAHYLSCLISVREDGKGARNNFTIIPDYQTTTSVSASALAAFVSRLETRETTRGGSVGLDGEIKKIEEDK